MSPRGHAKQQRERLMSDINKPGVPTFFLFFIYSVLVSISVFMALSAVFHSINSPDNSPCSDSVRPVLHVPYMVLSTLFLYLKVSFIPDIIPGS